MYLLGFPLLLIPFAIYNMIAFLTPGVSWTAPVTTGVLRLMIPAFSVAILVKVAPKICMWS